jgi:hypothetical protein
MTEINSLGNTKRRYKRHVQTTLGSTRASLFGILLQDFIQLDQ